MKALTSEKSQRQRAKEANSPPPTGWKINGFLRVFAYGEPIDYVLEGIGIVAALGSGTALALVNLVLGNFMTVLSDATSDSSIPDNFMSEVSKLSLNFVYIGIARLVLTYVYSTLLTYVSLRLTRNLRHQYLRAALSQEVGYFDQGTGGSIAMQATSNGKLIQMGTAEKLGQLFQALATFIAAFILAFVTQWKLTLIILCIIPALLLIVTGVVAIDAGIETMMLKIYAQAAAYAEAVLSNPRTVHAFNLRRRVVAKYSAFLAEARVLGNKKNALYGFMFGGESFVMFAGMGLAFWQGIAMMERGEVAGIGNIFTVLFSVVIAAATVNSVAPHMVTFSRAATAASELFLLIDRQSEIDAFQDGGDKLSSISGTIRLQQVTFSYPTRPDVRVLDDFNLDIPAGKVTALVGPSGSGKSTIIGLLERWYNPSSGTIRLDGRDISKLNLKWLRTNIRLVQQEPILFNGSIFENIVHGLVGTEGEKGSKEQQLERVKEAAKVAFAHDFIENLPQGYETRVGERGSLLSGGQKQRVAIARSIVSNPKILLLDEATSALDPNAEAIVQKALEEASKDRTTIVIAHKLKTIQGADNIVVMKDGRIIEQGRHGELVTQQGAYSRLVKAQDLVTSKRLSDSDETSDDESPDLALEATESLVRRKTSEMLASASSRNREDFNLANRTGVIRTIFKLVKATPEIKWWYALCIVSCIIGAGSYPGQTLLLGNVMDALNGDDRQKRGNFISLMFFVMSIGLLTIYWILGWATNVIAQALSQRVRQDIFGATLRQDLSFFDRPENTVGSLASHLDTHAQSVMELMGFNIALILMAIINIIASGIMSIAFSWKLGLVGVFAGLPPMVAAGYIRIRVETKMDLEIDRKFSKSSSIASEAVAAIRTVASLAIETDVLQRYTDELDAAINGSKSSLFFMMIWFSFTQAVEYFILALGFWWGSKLVSGGQITFYQFIVSFMGVYFSGQAAGQMFSFASSFTKANSAANYYFWLCNLQPTIQESEENKETGPRHECASYSFENVHFSYPLAPSNRVLKGVSFKVHPGQFVAFVGASGCGKSTMIALLERFYDPNSGSILIDGSDTLSTINPVLYRRRLALVQQEPTLFPGSIRDNIVFGLDLDDEQGPGRIVADDKVIESACRAANAWDFVSSLPDGLNTLCGTSGNQLSGGQRQRIAIARALIRNPSVILLDEATSALDTESERVVQSALLGEAVNGRRITIAVAHRLSTIRNADKIFVFFRGRILESGSHSELVALGGMYQKMCEAQSLDKAV